MEYEVKKLSDYKDWLTKAKYDYEKFKSSNDLYDLVNCILALNTLPEWIEKGDATQEIRDVAIEKIAIMKTNAADLLDENQLGQQINHQLRFIRTC